jgi:hypothetical protein
MKKAVQTVVITLISLTTLGLGMAIPMQAKAESINFGHSGFSIEFGHRYQRQYDVYYRYDRFEEWQLAGSYRYYEDADQVVRRLERRGYRAWIETSSETRW